MPFSLLGLFLALACSGCADRRPSDPPQSVSAADSVALRPADPTLRAAADAINAGHPWRATQLLSPIIADSTRRTPEAIYLAAAAAAGWEGWREVERLLDGATWLDSLFGGEPRALLARSALALRRDTLAADRAAASLGSAASPRARGLRLVLLARARDRVNDRDSAQAAYAAAAALLPEVGDWLRLRAAGVAADSAARAAYYAPITNPAARARVSWTDASARERTGDLAGAARAYGALGATPTSLRLRLAAAGRDADTAARLATRDELVAFIRRYAGTSDARTAVEVLDAAFPTLTPEEELAVGRGIATVGPAGRAARAFERAAAAKLPFTDADRWAYAGALDRAGLDRDAAAAYARVTAPRSVAAAAAYQRGRALLGAGDRAAAQRALRDAAARFPRDTSAANALALLADLATDDKRDADARSLFLRVAREFPSARVAPRSRFRAAVIAIAAGSWRAAATELDTLRTRYPSSDEATAAGYWAGRAWAAAGDSAAARERWRAAVAREPLSYYAAQSARRLGEAPWGPPAAPAGSDAAPVVPAVDSAFARAALLESLGLDTEARFEYDRIARGAAAGAAPETVLATAHGFLAAGQPSRAIALGWQLIDRGAVRDVRAYRLAYPVLERELLDREAKERGLDPALVAAVIRQESSFNPRATSPVGARGLMQLMPSVGKAIADSRGIAPWDPNLLYQAEVNVPLGVSHLASFSRQLGPPERVLAAYNAGNGRVSAWAQKPGTDDPELFIERIPFAETRDYVRIVLRNRDMYRSLYEW
ncbi:MAG TPA: lytic transglycosylase domain-containing protein [Gemmatimonadaceae bacterium]|nr:lytic transglycosylase domain-containing protein [Gemmatimonadaceae bacterium]